MDLDAMSQSQKTLTEMLGFDLDDGDECDTTTEDDLIFLKDPSADLNLTVGPNS